MLNSAYGQIITATLIFLVLDGIWLAFLSNKLYSDTIGPLMRLVDGKMQPNWGAAVIVYIALISGILLFVLPRANGMPLQALFWGGFFGFVTYATYDFTNLAVLANWPLKISIIDTTWGIILCGLTSFLTVLITI